MRTGSGEEQLEQIQEELINEIEVLLAELKAKIIDISKNREGYDLTDFITTYLNDAT